MFARYTCALSFTFLFIISLMIQAQKPGDEYQAVDRAATTEAMDDAEALPASVTIRKSQVIRPWSPQLFGYNHNWIWANKMIMDQEKPDSLDLDPAYLKLVEGSPLPLNRMSGTGSQYFSWKKAIGPLSDREPMSLTHWQKAPEVQRAGPVEWINSVLRTDPQAKFVWVFNMTKDSVADCADMVEFLTGDPEHDKNGDINWAAKRVKLGLPEPVRVAAWELGNEIDWHRHIAVAEYIKQCQAIIKAVRAIDPEARFAAHAATAPWSTAAKKPRADGDWKVWHREVLKTLGEDIESLVLHPYYHGLPIPELEEKYLNVLRDDILSITGSDRIKLFISEHAMWPPRPKDQQWSTTWYQTHGLIGSLATAEWLNRMLNRPDIGMMTYHCYSGGPWGAIYRDKEGTLYTTAIHEMFNLLLNHGGTQVLATEVKGEMADIHVNDLSLTVTAIETASGLNLVLVNRDPNTPRELTFTFEKNYHLNSETTLTAKDLHAYNTSSDRPITINTTVNDSTKPFTTYTLAPKALTILTLSRVTDDLAQD